MQFEIVKIDIATVSLSIDRAAAVRLGALLNLACGSHAVDDLRRGIESAWHDPITANDYEGVLTRTVAGSAPFQYTKCDDSE